MKFCLGSLYFLGAWMLVSLLRIPALALCSAGLWIWLLFSLKRALPAIRVNQNRWELMAPLLIASFQALMVFVWLRDIWVLPSNDDTIAHLSYLSAIFEQKSCLTGHLLKPGSEFFGEARYVFYPTGSHALIALFTYPFSLLGVGLPELVSFVIRLILVLWPIGLWSGLKTLRPDMPRSLRVFLVISAITLPSFPLFPLGEGGLSRIFAMIFFTPLWFGALAGRIHGFAWTAILAPTLLFIHPSLLPFLGLAIPFFSRKHILRAIAGAPLGAFLFWVILRSGANVVSTLNFLPEFSGWFDRLKGPFHYWFGDPYGFGKFLSPKNFPIYLGLGLMLARKADPRIALLFLTPFILAASSFLPLPGFSSLGLIFYHSVKRMAELTPLLGITISGITLGARPGPGKKMENLLYVLSVAFVAFFAFKSNRGLDQHHTLYSSPFKSSVGRTVSKLNGIPESSILLNDDHSFDSLRFATGLRVFNLWTECQPVEQATPYCQTRSAFPEKMMSSPEKAVPAGIQIWWIPPKGRNMPMALAEISLNETGKAFRIK